MIYTVRPESDFTSFIFIPEMGGYTSREARIGSIAFTDVVDLRSGILLVNEAGYNLIFPTEFDKADLDRFFLSLGRAHIDVDGLVLTDAVFGSSNFHRRLAEIHPVQISLSSSTICHFTPKMIEIHNDFG